MKTLALILLSLTTFASSTRNIWFTSADTVAIGDSAWVDIKYNYTLPTDTCRIYISNSHGLWEVFKMAFTKVDGLKKYHTKTSVDPLDSVTRLRFIIPSCAPESSNYIANNQVSVYVEAATLSVREESREWSVISKQYFNIIGQVIRPATGEVFIEVIRYSNGAVQIKKGVRSEN